MTLRTIALSAATTLLLATNAYAGPAKPFDLSISGDTGRNEASVLTARGKIQRNVKPERKNFHGGIRIATGDVNGDGVKELITGAGPGGTPSVKVFDGKGKAILSLMPFGASFTGGVFVASADVNGDGRDDIVVGAGPGGGPEVKVFSGADSSVLFDFFAYDQSFTGGVRVAAADTNGDGNADIITAPGAGADPVVKNFSGTDLTVLVTRYAFDASVQGGVFVAAGDVDGDGNADIIAGPDYGVSPLVAVYNAQNNDLITTFYAYETSFVGGVRVAAGDVNGDGVVDIITGSGPSSKPHVKYFSLLNGTVVLDAQIKLPSKHKGGFFVGGGSRLTQ